jgi:hypothetical protein
VGAPSIPGAHSFGQVFPDADTTRGVLAETTVTTPFPAGNIATLDDRWKLIEQDTLPAYQHLLSTDFNAARGIVASDFAARPDAQRLSHQWDDIIKRLSDWDVDVKFKWPWQR